MNIAKEIIKIARKDIDKALALCEHLRALTDAPEQGPLGIEPVSSLNIEADTDTTDTASFDLEQASVTTNAELDDFARMAPPAHTVGLIVKVHNRAVAETLVGYRVVWGWSAYTPTNNGFDDRECVITSTTDEGLLVDKGYWAAHVVQYIDAEGDPLFVRVKGLPNGS